MRTVRIETRTVGSNFATVGVVRDARTGRKLGEGEVAPLGDVAAAIHRAKDFAESKGWVVAEEEE